MEFLWVFLKALPLGWHGPPNKRRDTKAAEGAKRLVCPANSFIQGGLRLRLRVCPAKPHDGEAFVRLSPVNLAVLVVEARASITALVDNALGVLRTAFRKVDGVIVNRQRSNFL
jgi:hypothetical protein